MDKCRFHLLISGRVQGVFYRKGAQKKAQELGLSGWAHNTADGRVEIVAEGEKESLDKFIEWCKEGTRVARVDTCEVEYQEYKNEFPGGFTIREFGF